MALRIQLRDGERMVVNGAVIRSSGRTQLFVENMASILRDPDIMTPEEATTPARRLYFSCMMAYLYPDDESYKNDVATLFNAIFNAFTSPEPRAVCGELAKHMATSDFYRALGTCRELIAYEAPLLEELNRAGKAP